MANNVNVNKYNAGTDSTHGANVWNVFYDKAGIKAANQKNIYQQFASSKQMPTKYGKTYSIPRWYTIYDRDMTSPEFQKYGFLASRDIADVSTGITSSGLAEGTTNKDGLKIQKTNLQCTLSRYGNELEYTDEVDLFSNDDVQVRYREELGKHANQLFEDLIQIDMLSTNTVIYNGLATSVSTMGTGIVADGTIDDSYRINYEFIRKCVQKLIRNRAEMNTEIVTGSTKIGTQPIRKAYYAIIGPEVYWDLQNLERVGNKVDGNFAFISSEKYADASKLAEGEVGAVDNVRFILSESALVERAKGAEVPANYVGTLAYSTDKTDNKQKFDVFPILFPTKESFATVGLKGNDKIKFNAKAPSDIDSGNRFGTIGFFTYNMWYAGMILQEEKLLKAYVLATNA